MGEPIALPFRAGDPLLDEGAAAALAVIERNLVAGSVRAGQRYPRPWLRDAYDGGIVPCLSHPALRAYVAGLDSWVARQGREPVYVWKPGHPHHVPGSERLEPGQVCTNRSSGDVDETLLFVNALAEAAAVAGGERARGFLPAAEAAWGWARRQCPEGRRLLYATPLVAADWADQIRRRGFCTNVEALWYEATRGLATLQALAGRPDQAARSAALAEEIRAELNEVLFRTSVPSSRNAAPIAAPFGHYVAWREWGRTADTFETDSNLRCVAAGIADPSRAASVVAFVRERADHLLGRGDGRPPPAKVVHGDYEPADYASIRDRTGDGLYHSQWWGWVGALAAAALARASERELAVRAIRGLAAALVDGARAGTGIREWYDAEGRGRDSEWFQWSARAYLLALWKTWLGATAEPGGLRLRPLAGGIEADVTCLGRTVRVRTVGEGPRAEIRVGRRSLTGDLVSAEALRPRATISVMLSPGP